MAGKSNRRKNRGRASKDNSKVVADANGVQQSNLGDKPSGVDESTSAKSEVVDTMQTTSSNQPKLAEVVRSLVWVEDDMAWIYGKVVHVNGEEIKIICTIEKKEILFERYQC